MLHFNLVSRSISIYYFCSLVSFSCMVFGADPMTYEVKISNREGRLIPSDLLVAFSKPKDGVSILDAEMFKNGVTTWAECAICIEVNDNNKSCHKIFIQDNES